MRTAKLETDLIRELKELQKEPEQWEIAVRSTKVEVGTNYNMSMWEIKTAKGGSIEGYPFRVTAILHEHSSPIYTARNIVGELERRLREAEYENT